MPIHIDPGHIDPGHIDPGHIDPGHIEGGHIDPGHIEGGHIDPGHIEGGHIEGGHIEGGHIDDGHIDDGATRRTLSVSGDTITPRMSGDAFELFEVTGPEGSGPPPHAHPWDEGYLVLAGELVVGDDDGERTLRAGDAALVEGGTIHWYRVASEGLRFLTVTSGRRAGAFFADIDAHVPGPPTPETLPVVAEVARRNGLTSPLF